MSELAIQGYPSSHRAPIEAAEIVFNQGESTAGRGGRTALFTGPITSAGTWTTNTVYEVFNENDAKIGAGAGSPLHRAVRAYLKAYQGGKVYALPFAETSGTTDVAADMTIIVTFGSGSNPAGTESARIWVCGERIDLTFGTSDTATTIGDAIEAAINQRTHLPLTASNTTGTVTLTAKVDGLMQGDGTVGVLRVHGEVDAGANTVLTFEAAALGLGTGTDGAEGSTTEIANLTTALATIASVRYDYIGITGWSADYTEVLETHVSNKSEPNPGKRSVGVYAYPGTRSAGATIAIARNDERIHCIWQENSEHDPAELVGNAIAVMQKREPPNVDGGFVHDHYRESDWLIKSAYAVADWPSEDDINDAITDGMTPIASSPTGSELVMLVNTRSKDSTGALDDFRSTERHRVSYMDLFVDELLLQFALTFRGFKLKDDQYLPDGVTVDPNQVVPPRVLTPSRFRPWLARRVRSFEERAMFQNADAWIASMQIRVDPQNSSRLQSSLSGRTIDILHQFTARLNETSPG